MKSKKKFIKILSAFVILMFQLVLKKDEIFNCRAPGCTNQADKNSSIITLVTIIILIIMIIIITHRDIMRTLAYLILEAHSKPCQIFKLMRHTENFDIVITVYLGIFKHVQGHSAIFSHVQVTEVH